MVMDDRGPLDLTRRIEDLEKQKKILQSACRRAGKTIKKLQNEVERKHNEFKKIND
jgi:chaperonin cofactor prefoldin